MSLAWQKLWIFQSSSPLNYMNILSCAINSITNFSMVCCNILFFFEGQPLKHTRMFTKLSTVRLFYKSMIFFIISHGGKSMVSTVYFTISWNYFISCKIIPWNSEIVSTVYFTISWNYFARYKIIPWNSGIVK